MGASASLFAIFAISLMIIDIATASSAQPESIVPEGNELLLDTCRHTNNADLCLHVLKRNITALEHKFNGNHKKLAIAVIDLAIVRSEQIRDLLNRYYAKSQNEVLKMKYIRCSKNYNDATRNLKAARDDVVSGEMVWDIPVEINDSVEELNSCKDDFDEKAFDPAHIRNRNNEFGVYLDMITAVVEDFLVVKRPIRIGSDDKKLN